MRWRTCSAPYLGGVGLNAITPRAQRRRAEALPRQAPRRGQHVPHARRDAGRARRSDAVVRRSTALPAECDLVVHLRAAGRASPRAFPPRTRSANRSRSRALLGRPGTPIAARDVGTVGSVTCGIAIGEGTLASAANVPSACWRAASRAGLSANCAASWRRLSVASSRVAGASWSATRDALLHAARVPPADATELTTRARRSQQHSVDDTCDTSATRVPSTRARAVRSR